MQHTIVILTILLPEVFRRKWAQKWPIFDETPLYRKSCKSKGCGRVAGSCQFFDLILNNAPALRAGKKRTYLSKKIANIERFLAEV